MFLGYNTNGLAHHDLFDAVELLAHIGYRGVAITIDHNALPPADCPNFRGHRGEAVVDENGTVPFSAAAPPIIRLRTLLEKLGMRSVIETGARFLLDPRKKHEPTLLSDSPRRRIDFYKYAIDCAAQLGSDCVSIWSGKGTEVVVGENSTRRTDSPRQPPPSPSPRQPTIDRLVAGLREVLDYAAAKNVLIAFEPEPGMFIDTMAAFEELLARSDAPNLCLTLDVGHLQCQGELPIPEVIRRWAPRLANLHIEDMRRGTHEHLMFGEGEIDFPPVLQALAEVNYPNGIYVELSRHSHEGPTAAKRAFEFLERCLAGELVRREGATSSQNTANKFAG
jgi:L-ribulose-5-phosphate 3-epimerase